MLPLGWTTDLAVLRYMGSTIEDRGDHLVVRTPRSPDFHWGNCRMPSDVAAWARLGLELGFDEVLATSTMPGQTVHHRGRQPGRTRVPQSRIRADRTECAGLP
jgi:hypothetical protein